jgi:TolB-like protein/tetratricopeptide (TPR) repeat protein
MIRPSVAVRLQYDDPLDDARLADGLTIEITRMLTQIDGLDVRSPVRASRYRDRREDTGTFDAARGAGLVLEGLMITERGVVRHINTSLVRTDRGTVLWSRSFSPRQNDVFAVGAAIADAIADTLERPLVPGRRRYSADPDLQTSFLRARALQADGGAISRPEAVDLLERITLQGSTFIPAFAALATTLGGHLSISGPPTRHDLRMDAAAHVAYTADPSLAEANVAMGLLSARVCQWARADMYFAEALRRDRSAIAAYTDYVISTLLPTGRIDAALEVLRSALAVDPASANVLRTLTYVQLQNNDPAGALESSRWVLTHHPDQEFADQSHGRALYLSQRFDEALTWFGRGDAQWGNRGYLLARMGNRDDARALAEKHPNEPARQLLIYAGLNDAERAIDALRRTAIDNPWRALVWMQWPEIQPILRGHPKAAAIRAQLLRPADEDGCALSNPASGSASGSSR